MAENQGVFAAVKKDGTTYYRASVTYKGKHISLGSYDSESDASRAYFVANAVLRGTSIPKCAASRCVGCGEIGGTGVPEEQVAGATCSGDASAPAAFAAPAGTPAMTAAGAAAESAAPVRRLYEIDDFESAAAPLTFDKWVMLINLSKSGIYCRNPILLEHKFFYYYIDRTTALKFDVDDLFYYMNHKIMRRGGRLFVADYGMQVGILSRYGIKSFAVQDRDYRFKNGDAHDLRYSNIEILSRYFGVVRTGSEGRFVYTAKVHLNGDILIGRYKDEIEAAVAYNKATDILTSNGFARPFYKNYIEDISDEEYHYTYKCVQVSRKIKSLRPTAAQ